MKLIKKYSALIALVVLAVYDAVVLLLRKQANMHKLFWLGFIFVQAAFVIYIALKFALKNREGERGVKPLDLSLFFFMVLMIIMSFIAYILPDKPGAFTGMLIGYIILTGIALILVIFGLLNKAIVKENDTPKPQMFDESDMIQVLNETLRLTTDEAAKKQIQIIIDRINGLEIDEKSLKGKQLLEYIQFMYKNAKRGEMNNIFYNIKKAEAILDELAK